MKTIGNIVNERKLELSGHMSTMGDERLIRLIMLSSRIWKSKTGRSRRLRIDDVAEAMGVGKRQTVRMAQNTRGCWKVGRKVKMSISLDGP